MLTLFAPFDWRHLDGGLVKPDLLVIRRSDFDRHGPLAPSATPLLVIEILSPANPQYDQAVKRELYQRLAVPAYWIIDPDAPSVLELRLTDGAYRVEAEVSGDQQFMTDWPFPLQFHPADLIL